MSLARLTRMTIGAGIGTIVGTASILPLYLFIASVGMVPGSWERSVMIFLVLCLPLFAVGAMSERHEGPNQQRWFRQIIPVCLGVAATSALLCAGAAFVSNEAKTDASVVCFASFGWLSGMQGAFFIMLSRDEVRRSKIREAALAAKTRPIW